MAEPGALVVPIINFGSSVKKEPDSKGFVQPVLKTPQINFSGTTKTKIVVESAEDLAKIKRVFRVLNFGHPGTFKTHLGLDMPSPVIAIDTEDRVHLISKKFKHCNSCDNDWYAKTFTCPNCGSKDIWLKDIQRIKAKTIDEIDAGVDKAIMILEDVEKHTGKMGTLMVDSWTEGWAMVHIEHYDKYYKGRVPSEVQLSPRDDYKHINPRHNELRKKILECGFNVYLTATEGEVYGTGDDQFKVISVKAEGQKHNPHAVDWWIHSFIQGNDVLVIFEKSSIAARNGKIMNNFDYDKMCEEADILEKQEMMLTMELLDQIKNDLIENAEDKEIATEITEKESEVI